MTDVRLSPAHILNMGSKISVGHVPRQAAERFWTAGPDESTDIQPTPAGDSDDADVIHIVSEWQAIGDKLKLWAPHALCGASLKDDLDRPDLNPVNAAPCHRCLALNGGLEDPRWVPKYQPRRWLPSWLKRGQR
jgi:hypothetical protein